MTTSEMLRRIRSAWDEIKGGFYLAGTTTSNGNAGGTTMIATGLTALDDFYNQKEVLLTSGTASGQRRLISDFVASSDTITLEETVGFLIASGVTFELGEAGFWSDREILDWVNDGQADMVQKLTDDYLAPYLGKVDTTVGTAGVASFPTDYIRTIPKHTLVGGVVAPFVPSTQYRRFISDTYTPGDSNRPIGIIRNSELHYRPATNLTITWDYIRRPLAITISQTSELPEDIHAALCDYAIHRGWLKAQTQESQALANRYFGQFMDKIGTVTQQWQRRLRVQS